MKKYLNQVCDEFGISLSEKQLEQFQVYYDYLLEMNQVMNLTAITEKKEVVIKHFLDSMSIVKYFSFDDIQTVIDVGTGAGFPGIPLAILLPNTQFTLMDSLNKRISFLKQVCEKCGLENVTCIHSRAEELGRDEMYREKYDVCVSRAVANLSVLLEYCIPFIKKRGTFISYKSLQGEDELQVSQNAQNKLCCKLVNNISFYIGNQDYARNFLIFEKFDVLSDKYPRQNGLPKKKPL
jgi:16S rRNA (guanine527-N7)-methyltransferase